MDSLLPLPEMPHPASHSDAASAARPLAERLRPQLLDEVIGQQHLLGAGRPIRIAFESGQPHSMILWGPPGVGKTTLARLMADAFGFEFIALSAVFAGVKEIRAAIDQAKIYQSVGKRTILFVDEIHRFNKSQQDGLLPFVESGLVVFVGATTENPSFEVNSALLSRAQVHVLQALAYDDLKELLNRAVRQELSNLTFTNDAVDLLIAFADGDGRRFLNLLEQVANGVNSAVVNCAVVDSPKSRDRKSVV